MKIFGAICFAGLLTISASAGVIYDNTAETVTSRDPAYGNNANFTPYGPLYNQFETGTNGTGYFQLSSLSMMLQNCDTTGNVGTGNLDCGGLAGGSGATIALYGDNSNTPGGFIASLGTVNDSQLTTTPGLFSVSLANNPILNASTQYWIGLTGNDANTTVSWNWDSTCNGTEASNGTPACTGPGTGVYDEYASNATGAYSSAFGPYMMNVQGTDYTPSGAPEPVTSVLLGTGAVLIGLFRRKLIS
jgi:hypothetical protein